MYSHFEAFYTIVACIFSEVELPVAELVDELHITNGSEEPEDSSEGACTMAPYLSGAVSHDPSGDLELKDKLVAPEPKQMRNIQGSCHDFSFLKLKKIHLQSNI